MIIKGVTTHKLDFIKTYGDQPFVVGENGVLELNDKYVVYKIDDILYTTYFDTYLTYFSFEIDVFKEINTSGFIYDDSFGYDDKKNIESFINIQRNNFSVFEKFFYFSDTESVGDINSIPKKILDF